MLVYGDLGYTFHIVSYDRGDRPWICRGNGNAID